MDAPDLYTSSPIAQRHAGQAGLAFDACRLKRAADGRTAVAAATAFSRHWHTRAASVSYHAAAAPVL